MPIPRHCTTIQTHPSSTGTGVWMDCSTIPRANSQTMNTLRRKHTQLSKLVKRSSRHYNTHTSLQFPCSLESPSIVNLKTPPHHRRSSCTLTVSRKPPPINQPTKSDHNVKNKESSPPDEKRRERKILKDKCVNPLHIRSARQNSF